MCRAHASSLVFPEKRQAINYAESRACFRSGEIRININPDDVDEGFVGIWDETSRTITFFVQVQSGQPQLYKGFLFSTPRNRDARARGGVQRVVSFYSHWLTLSAE